jgi:hypothetical protein
VTLLVDFTVTLRVRRAEGAASRVTERNWAVPAFSFTVDDRRVSNTFLQQLVFAVHTLLATSVNAVFVPSVVTVRQYKLYEVAALKPDRTIALTLVLLVVARDPN